MITFEFCSFADKLPAHGDTIYLYTQGDELTEIRKAKVFYTWKEKDTGHIIPYEGESNKEMNDCILMFNMEYRDANYVDCYGPLDKVAQEWSDYHWMKRDSDVYDEFEVSRS